jgi:pimeloyl-ACP methyl ester carboxylesterase
VGVGTQVFLQYHVHCQNLADQNFAVILIDPSNYPESLSSGPVEWDKGLGYAKGAVNQGVVAGRLFFTDEWYLSRLTAVTLQLPWWTLTGSLYLSFPSRRMQLTYACRDPRVKAIVWNYGGQPWVTPYDPSILPPVLIFHGLDDDVYDVKYAKKLASELHKYGKYYEMHLYPNQKHMFTVYFDPRTEYPVHRPVIADSFQKQISFLYRMLQIPNRAQSIRQVSSAESNSPPQVAWQFL